MNNEMARTLNLFLGAWLVLSAFAWPHSLPQLNNTWVVGLLIAFAALLALKIPQVRYFSMLLSIWLFFSVWALPRMNVVTSWNNAIVAVTVFWISLKGSQPVGRGPSALHRGR